MARPGSNPDSIIVEKNCKLNLYCCNYYFGTLITWCVIEGDHCMLKQKEMNFQFDELTLFFSTDHVYKLWECEMGNTHPGHLYFWKTDCTCNPDCHRSY